jgi:hypothetical protein
MLTQILSTKGFEEVETGGGCRAMVRRREGATDVVTSSDGGSLPEDGDWLFATYEGDWLADADAEMKDCVDSESSPMHLLEVIDL